MRRFDDYESVESEVQHFCSLTSPPFCHIFPLYVPYSGAAVLISVLFAEQADLVAEISAETLAEILANLLPETDDRNQGVRALIPGKIISSAPLDHSQGLAWVDMAFRSSLGRITHMKSRPCLSLSAKCFYDKIGIMYSVKIGIHPSPVLHWIGRDTHIG